jgi:putative transposase
VAHLRADALHKVTTRLATTYGTVVVEDLNVAGMTARPAPRPDPDRPGRHLRNGARAKAGLNRAVLDASPAELRRQLASSAGGTAPGSSSQTPGSPAPRPALVAGR